MVQVIMCRRLPRLHDPRRFPRRCAEVPGGRSVVSVQRLVSSLRQSGTTPRSRAARAARRACARTADSCRARRRGRRPRKRVAARWSDLLSGGRHRIRTGSRAAARDQAGSHIITNRAMFVGTDLRQPRWSAGHEHKLVDRGERFSWKCPGGVRKPWFIHAATGA